MYLKEVKAVKYTRYAVVVYFKILSQPVHEETEENYNKVIPGSGPEFGPISFIIHVSRVNC
jgi:hypothetical protein